MKTEKSLKRYNPRRLKSGTNIPYGYAYPELEKEEKQYSSGIPWVTPVIVSIRQRKNKIKSKITYDEEMQLWRVDIK